MSFTRTLRAAGGVVVAGALLFGTAPVVSADEIRESQWPLEAFDAEAVWKESTGKGVTVALLDTSVDGSHPDIRRNVLPGIRLRDGDVANQGATALADHGTEMASIIAAHGHGPGGSEGIKGLAPDAKILPIDVYEEGEKDNAVPGSFAKGIKYAVDQGASVINISTAGTVQTPMEKRAIAYALKKDVLIVASSGNERAEYKEDDIDISSAPGVVAVGAMHRDGSIWKDSNYGPDLMLTAPGVDIRAAAVSRPYAFSGGTSSAAAYVSAAAALLRAKFPDLTAGQIANRLVKTAGKPPVEGIELPDPHYGYGIVRPWSALTKDIPPGPKNGPLEMPETSSAARSSGDGDSDGAGGAEAGKGGLGVAGIIGIAAGGLALIALVLVMVKIGKRRSG